MELIFIDVSELEPPEPMTKILYALSTSLPSQCLHINHRREPFPLYDKLNTAGWQYLCRPIAPEQFHIFIYRNEQRLAFEKIRKVIFDE